MDNLSEIKEKLYILYMEYKDNKSQLSADKSKEVVSLLTALTNNNKSEVSDVAEQLSVFSADIVKIYFDTFTKNGSIPISLLDEVLKGFLLTDKDPKKSQYYVQKFVFTVSTIMKNYKEKAVESTQLPRLVAFIAKYAVKSDKFKNKFQQLINDTTGGIYMLDYSGIPKGNLVNIWTATEKIYLDLSKAKFESFISDWGMKYGFIKESYVKESEISVRSNEESSVAESNKKSEESATNPKTIKTANIGADSTNALAELLTKELYSSFKKDISEKHESIITALSELIAPIGKTVESIQCEINKNHETVTDNETLRRKADDLQRQLSEQSLRLQEINQSLITTKAENDELRKQISTLEIKNSELDSKLNDAYAINSRESSLEAEKIRSELKKAFTFLYEDWLEYEFSNVSEENYESLQAIIKKIFRSLERNGIDFKGNNK